jgi:HlyD family secretion protein
MPEPAGASPATPQPQSPRPEIVPPTTPGPGRTKLWSMVLAGVVIAGGVAFYLTSQSKVQTGGGPIVTVPTVPVEMGDLHATVRVSGTVAAQNFASLLAPRIMGSRSGFQRGGTDSNFGGPGGGGGGGGGGMGGDFNLILLSLAKAGTHVKTGDVAGQFDPQFQQQRYDDYKDSVIQLENSIKKLIANLAATKEAHDQTVRSSKADWDKAVLDMQTAPIRSQIDAEKYKLAVEEAEAKYKELVAESALVEESQRASIRSSQLTRDQVRIELQRAETNVERMTVKSPMDGIVVMASIVRNGEYGQVREGDQVNAGQPFVTIVDPRSMVLNATVNQVDAEKLRLGMKASIRLDAYPDIKLPGTLIGIGAMSKTSTFRASYVGEIPVRIKIENTDPRLIPDLTGSAEIVLDSVRNTLLLPRAAVFEEADGQYVFVQGPEGWQRRKVDLGLTSFTTAAIKSGIQKGEVVALQRPL